MKQKNFVVLFNCLSIVCDGYLTFFLGKMKILEKEKLE